MKNNIPKLLNDRGVTAIILALLMTVFLGIAALAVDIGYNVMAKNQLQNAADAAALAGARQLGELYLNKAENNPLSDTNATLVDASARDTAKANKAAGDFLKDANLTIQIGKYDPKASTCSDGSTPDNHLCVTLTRPNAVHVNVQKGNISTFFARIFGKDSMTSQVVATAALSAICSGNPSPLGISESWFDVTNCGGTIDLNKTKDSCSGWTSLNTTAQDYKDLEYDGKKIYNNETDVLIGFFRGAGLLGINKTEASDPRILKTPEMKAGTTTNFTGGTLGNAVFDYISAAIAYQGAWDTTVVIYKREGDTGTSCKNPTGDLEITGFAKLRFTGSDSENKLIYATVICDNTDPERGCGEEFENKYVYSAIPSLVQ